MLERGGKDQNTVEKVAIAAESTASENATSVSAARKTDDSGGTSACAACDADRGKATGSFGGDHRQGA